MAIKYKEIASTLREQMISSASPISYKLPTEKELCRTYRVSRQTIRQALDLLTTEGFIYTRQGSGIYTIPLSSHTNGKVVFLLSEDDEYTYPAFVSDIKKRLAEYNITPVIHITDQNYNTERSLLTSLLKQPPVVLVVEGVRDGLYNPNIDLYEQLTLLNVSVIFLGPGYDTLPRAHRIITDDYMGGYLLAEHLIARDRYQVSCILPDFMSNARLRYQGFLAAYRGHSLPMPSDEIHWYGWKDVKRLRAKQDTHFLYPFIHSHGHTDAVFCYNDEIAYHLIKELGRAQISVPDEVSVVSFDNSYLSRISNPPLTTLSLEEHGLEKELAEQIHVLLKNFSMNGGTHSSLISYPPIKKTLPWKLISRNSVTL